MESMEAVLVRLQQDQFRDYVTTIGGAVWKSRGGKGGKNPECEVYTPSARYILSTCICI